MNVHTFALILVAIADLGQSRGLLFDAKFYKVEYSVLQKGKPIHLDQNSENVEINGITGTLYFDSLSKLNGVTVLSISNNQIKEIEEGALCSSPNVRALELNFYYTTEHPVLTKAMFGYCENIEELVLRLDKTKKMEVDALENLTNLKDLTVVWYNITRLSKSFLKINPDSLSNLTLLECNVEEIDDDGLEDFGNLEQLVIFHNKELTHLPKNLLRGLSKLKVLSLAHNNLKDLTWDEFEGLSSLRELVLSDNQITSYDVDKIAKNLPNLEKLSIDQNPPRCKEKVAIVEELKEKLPHLTDVTYRFQPTFRDSCEDLD